MKRLICAGLLACLAACSAPTTAYDVSPEEIFADRPSFEAADVRVHASPSVSVQCNAAACEGGGACNNCKTDFVYAGPSGEFLLLVPGDDWEPVGRALGVTPQPCYDRWCMSGVELGCHGNDFESVCSPAVPARITAVVGTIVGDTLVVSSVELADSPTEVAGGSGAWPSPRLRE